MNASSFAGSDQEFVDGIAQGHAYTILSVHTVQYNNASVRLLKIRNPWGRSGEWNGVWSDKSTIWTDSLKNEVGWTDADDGTFFISLEDYLSHFSETTASLNNMGNDC
jgi:hypothetical protein